MMKKKAEHKSHSLTIYLLKKGIKCTDALVKNHKLEKVKTHLKDIDFYLMDIEPTQPWWKNFLGIEKQIEQVLKGGILFISEENRNFAITFGHVNHKLNDNAYETDFGLKITLNSIDPKVKSFDFVNLSGGIRARIQSPIPEDINFFDFYENENMIKSLVGNVKESYNSYFSNVTGCASVRITTCYTYEKLKELCKKLFIIYQNNEYKKVFPSMDNIEVVNDSNILEILQNDLINAINQKKENIYLMPPTIINYKNVSQFSYTGLGRSLIYSEINIKDFYNLLEKHNNKLKNENNVNSIQLLQKIKLKFIDANDNPIKEEYSIFKCLVYDTKYNGKNYYFHEGKWYKIEVKFINTIQSYIDKYLIANTLPSYNHSTENEYNRSVENKYRKSLDTMNISIQGNTQVEPCDIYEVKDNYAILYHIKISTKSSLLSHLFNQGYNATLLIKQEERSLEKLKLLLKNDNYFISPLTQNKIKVVYGIISRNIENKKLSDLPLFSQITLYRVLKNFNTIGVDAKCMYIEDMTQPASKKKKNKMKNKVNECKNFV